MHNAIVKLYSLRVALSVKDSSLTDEATRRLEIVRFKHVLTYY